jgi:hypothetical protein
MSRDKKGMVLSGALKNHGRKRVRRTQIGKDVTPGTPTPLLRHAAERVGVEQMEREEGIPYAPEYLAISQRKL